MSAEAAAQAIVSSGAADRLGYWPRDIDLPDGFLPPDELSAVKRQEGYEDVVRLAAGVTARWTAIFVLVKERFVASGDEEAQCVLIAFLRCALEHAKLRQMMLHMRCCVLERCGLLECLVDFVNTRSASGAIVACVTLTDVLLGMRIITAEWRPTDDMVLLQFLSDAHGSFWTGRGNAAVAGIIKSAVHVGFNSSARSGVASTLYHAAAYMVTLGLPLDDSVVDAGLFNLVAACLSIDGYVTAVGPELTAKTLAFRLLRCWQPMAGVCDMNALARHRDKLAELGILNAAVKELRMWQVESFIADERSVELPAALILVALLPSTTQPAVINAVVADALRVINACARRRVEQASADLMIKLGFQALKKLFCIRLGCSPACDNAAFVAYHAGALTPMLRALAEHIGSGASRDVIRLLDGAHQRAVDAADAAMAELVAEEESATKASKSKSKAKKRKTAAAGAGGASGATGGASGDAADLQPPPAPPPAPALVPPAAAAPAAARAPAPPLPAAVVRAPVPAKAVPPAAAAPRAAPAPALPAAIAQPAPPAPPPLPAYLLQAGAARPPPAAPLPAPVPARAASAATITMAECCVCLDDVAMAQLHALFPCGHRCLCGTCAATLMATDPAARCCPKCRAAVMGSAQIFDG